jgi:deoxycytidine triphosphate deaminase
MMSEHDNFATRKEREKKRLQELADRRPKDDKDFPFVGVLLDDAIRKCCQSFGLITPFKEENLKPANYKISVGDEYAIRGKIHALSHTPDDEIRIEPFEVAIIKTLETINMPRFLIARWNIQVSKAYKGLLWVGGPQVDAGYVGHLFCPIYNLSDQPVILRFGNPIAVIDFEKTTTFHVGESHEYKGLPDRVLLEDYEPEHLQSALATQAENKIKTFDSRLESLTSRIDFFVTITFALLGILFAAGALFVTEPEHHQTHWWDPSVFWICVTAIVFSGWALVVSYSTPGRVSRKLEFALWAFILVLVGIGLVRERALEHQMDQLKTQIQTPMPPQRP